MPDEQLSDDIERPDAIRIANLIRTLKDRGLDWQIRGDASHTLGEIGQPAIPIFKELLNSEEILVRSAAIYQLGIIGDRSSLPVIIKAMQDKNEDYQIRCSAIHAMGEMGDASAIPVLMELLRDSDESEDYRTQAAGAIGNIGLPALPVLLEALTDDDWSVRWHAVSAIGETGDPSAIPALTQVLEDENDTVRTSAVVALRFIGGALANQALIYALQSKQSDVRSSACSYLGTDGDTSVVPALAQLLLNTTEEMVIRWNAGAALGRMGESGTIALWEAAKNEDADTRKIAESTLRQKDDNQSSGYRIRGRH